MTRLSCSSFVNDHITLPYNRWENTSIIEEIKNLPHSPYFTEDILMGIGMQVASLPTINAIGGALTRGKKTKQDVMILIDKVSRLPSIWSTLLKIALICYGIIGAPIFEELIFREVLYDPTQKRDDLTKDPLPKRVFRIVTNGVLFGIAHLSPFQTLLTNWVVLIVISIMGMVFAYLREMTGRLTAPIAAHMTNNGLAFLSLMYQRA